MKRSNVGVHGGNDHFYLLIFVSVTILNYPFEKIDHPIVGYVVAFIVFVIVLALMIAPHMEVVDSRYDVVVRLDGTTKGIGLLCLVSSLLLGNVAFVNYSGRNLAVDYSNFNEPTIINGNLYYFSWASFLSSAQLFVKSYNNLFGIPVIRNWDSADDFTDLVGASRIRRFSCWVWLFLSNTIVALSATAVYINECQGDEMKVSRRELNKFCMKNETSLAISIVTSLFPIVVMCTKFDLDEYDSFPLLLERVISIVILVVNMVSIFIGTYYNGKRLILKSKYFAINRGVTNIILWHRASIIIGKLLLFALVVTYILLEISFKYFSRTKLRT